MKLTVSGIKVSPELAQIDVAQAPGVTAELEHFLGALAERCINVPFLTLSGPDAETAATLCVAAADRALAEQVGQSLPGLWPHLTVVSPVVAVSVFPHRSRATLLTRVLDALMREEIPVLALGSSLAALTITLGRGHLARALEVFDRTLELPANHAPLQAALLVKQLCE